MNELGKVSKGMNRMLRSRSLGKNKKTTLYEGVVVLTALYGGDEAWNIRVAQRRLNVKEVRCLRGVSGIVHSN